MALQPSFSPSSSSCSFSSSSSSFSYAWKYHVFLSFRGPDTRHGFIGHLHKALSDRGIHTFFDDEELQRGEEITPSLAEAIEESRIAIPVFSENYASSAFCLDELVKIMECVKGKGRLVLPVFYDVDPRDVRRQSGSYGEALARHEDRFKDDKGKVQRWREALHQAANLSGEHFKPGNEYEYCFIAKIVKEISKRISRVPLHVANYPVGMESRVLEVNRLLNDGSDSGVHMVGIYGVGGIGKTTLAKAVYNSIADQFEGLCFLENMSELAVKNGLPYLQKMLLSQILGEKDCDLGSVSELIPIISERLRCKKVLLVLDNVDNHEQLQVIIGRPDWLGSGSRVIITTRNRHLLTLHEVKEAYEVGVLSEEEALDLFTWMAFKSKNVEPCYMDILKQLVIYASGLPLALEVIGSSLFGRCVEDWRSALDEYQKIPNGDVQKTLKVSFEALHLQEKNIFLDIACCFNGYKWAEVVDILHAHYGVDPKYSIRVLADKSLINITNGFHGVITLHDLIQDMGREIVRLESPEKPRAHSRLWLVEDIVKVLQEDEGSSKTQLINLECDYNGNVIQWDELALKKMKQLRTLIIKNGRFCQGHKYLPSSSRVLKWEMHPSQEYLQFDFHPKQLVIFALSRNCFDSVQVAKLLKKKFENMIFLRVDDCEHITKIPNLSSAPKLEALSFARCHSLTEIDESVGYLDKLKTLDASKCSQLRGLPPLMLPSLEDLDLYKCTSLESFPEILGKMERLRRLSLYSVPIKKFPYSIHNLTGLRSLDMDGGGIVELPSSIKLLKQVETLRFRGCKGLLLRNEDEGEEQVSSMSFSNKTELLINDCNISEEFFRIAIPVFPRLESLSLKWENFRILPKCIEGFQFLRKLHLFHCNKLEEIRGIPPNIEELFVVNCTSLSALTREMLLDQKLHEEGQDKMFILPEPEQRLPMWFEHRRRDLSIGFWFRNNFPAISFGLFTRSDPLDQSTIRPRLTINGAKSFQLVAHDYEPLDAHFGGHILIFSKTQTTFRDQVGEALSENEWNCAVIAVYDDEPFNEDELDCVQVGIHIIKQKSCMDDISFTDPLSQNQCDTLRDVGYSHEAHTQSVQQQTSSTDRFLEWQCDTVKSSFNPKDMSSFTTNLSFTDPLSQNQCDTLRDVGYSHEAHTQSVQQQTSSTRFLEWQCDTVKSSFNPKDMSSFTTNLNVQDRAVLNPVESLDDVPGSPNSEPQSPIGSHVEQPMDDASDNPDPEQSASAIHGTNGPPKQCIVLFLCLLLIVVSLFGSAMWHWCFHHNDILTGTSLQEHQRLTSINQHNLEGCESMNKAKGKGMVALTCNSNAAEDDGKKPIAENLSTTKAVSGSYESSFHPENVDQLVNSLMKIEAPSPQPLDPLAELERVLQGSYDLPPESTSPTAASSSDIQASEVVISLQNLEPLLDNPLESLIADGEIKHQILDCLSKLGLLEDQIPIPLQSVVAQVRDFYEEIGDNFPSIQQTLVDYSCLEETRSKFLENLNQAKEKQAEIDAEVLRGKVQVEELDTEIADLEIKLKAAVEKRNELKLAIKNGEAEKSKLLKDAPAWLMESKQVVKKIKSSEHAYRDAQNSKARLEGRLAMLKGAFAANNNKR